MSDVLDALCFEGKTISISATITNTDQARRILGTMYNPNDEIGLSVNSWGLFNETEALQNRENLRREMEMKHRVEMDSLMSRSLRSFVDGRDV